VRIGPVAWEWPLHEHDWWLERKLHPEDRRVERERRIQMNEEKQYTQLLSHARAGDRESLGELAVLVWDRLYPYVLRTTLNRDVTEDILQETLLAMICRIDGLRSDERFWPWIYRIAWSRIQNRLRCRHRQSTLLGSEQTRSERCTDDESVLDATIRAETLEQISSAVEQLNRRYRDILRLRTYEQLPYTEIASRTRITPEKARVRFHRAKESLRKHLLTGCV
jgi:RNA polymerase sigma-70 factor (ECF subfamily)